MTTTSSPVTEPGAVMPSGQGGRARLARLAQRQGALVVLAVLLLVASAVFDDFLTTGNLSDLAIRSSFLAVVALGMTFVIMTGGIDLSVGSLYALGGVLAAWGSQHGVLVAVLLPLGACGLFGLVQGLIITRGGLPPFIVTLAGLLGGRGLVEYLTDEGATTYKVPPGSGFRDLAQGELLGLNYPVWLALLLFAVGGVVLHRTSYGTGVLAIGGQPDAARLMGLPVARTTTIAYAVSGLLAGLGGLLIASYTSSGVPTNGEGFELEAIAAVVLGGTLLTGGAGTVLGTLVGVLLLRVTSNVINQIGTLQSEWQAVTSGAILLVVVVLQTWLSRVQRR